MVQSKTLILYIFFLIFYSFFVSGFALEKVDKQVIDYAVVTNTFIKLNESESLMGNILKYVLLPFILVDIIFIVFGIISISFITMPPIVSLMVVSPAGIIVTIDYILPYLRGN